ncbi:RES domain-containing protein [Haloferula sp. A504]|uniref:RES domain-containing protein n=1 Tax=Haloferula sp. A504 TaxID=3373601 RepID=UPI0031C8CC0C|nr:RES family NAD+ phosphorylase [Verrucomicrobiaceae bacterium E54]
MKFFPDRRKLLDRLRSCGAALQTRVERRVYRFVKPQYTSTADQFAGMGARFADGRWLLHGGRLVTYTSLLPETALSEALAANRYYGFPDERAAPLVFVTAEVRLRNVVDLRNGSVRQRLRLSEATIIETDWRADNLRGQESMTEAWGWAFGEWGVEGFLCRSAAARGGSNLIVFPENLRAGSRVRVLNEVEWPR